MKLLRHSHRRNKRLVLGRFHVPLGGNVTASAHTSLYLTPPSTMERPSTSSTLPMIDPVIEAFTTLTRPLDSAMPAMISSAAFPKVALSNPPRSFPTRAARSSVARPIQPATGIMPRAEQTKSAVGFPCQNRRRTEDLLPFRTDRLRSTTIRHESPRNARDKQPESLQS